MSTGGVGPLRVGELRDMEITGTLSQYCDDLMVFYGLVDAPEVHE